MGRNEKMQEESKRGRRDELSREELMILGDVIEVDYSYDDLLKLFIDDCELRNLREHTIKYYRGELSAFRNLMQKQMVDMNVRDWTGETIKTHGILYMKDKGLKPVTINTRLRAVRAFFNFLEHQNLITNNPMKDIKLLRDRRRIVETFDKKQIKVLLSSCDLRSFTGLRDYTIMLLLLETGVRANELIGINVTDIVWSQKVIRIRNTKGSFERFVPFQNKMKDVLKKYISIRGVVETDSLFITHDNTPLSKKQIQDRIRDYGKKANIENVRCSLHTFRHTFAKMCVLGGCNAFQLQAILGHSTLEVTKVYVNLFSNEVQEGHSKFSPLKNIF
ncbi:recombinase XerD [Bacillus sp. HNG]|nr:recombinase XerD [Bacillus sp. HNG]